jgi:hypothetical protein
MNSLISEIPGPLVGVNARAPAHPAPITMPAAASSSSACTMQYRCCGPSPGRCGSAGRSGVNASISDVDGVIGYQAPTVAPA